MTPEQCGFWFGVGFGLPTGAALLRVLYGFEAVLWGRG